MKTKTMPYYQLLRELAAFSAATVRRRRQRRLLQFGRLHKLLFGMVGDAIVLARDSATAADCGMASGVQVMATGALEMSVATAARVTVVAVVVSRIVFSKTNGSGQQSTAPTGNSCPYICKASVAVLVIVSSWKEDR
jgi:hypothetical protein